MGYTHYWTRPKKLPETAFLLWREDIKKLLDNLPEYSENAGGYYADAPLSIVGKADRNGSRFAQGIVWFNGAGAWDDCSLGCEDFFMRRISKEMNDFCKTERRPYDLVVTAALIRFQYRFGSAVSIASDGKEKDWAHALSWCQKLFGEAKYPCED